MGKTLRLGNELIASDAVANAWVADDNDLTVIFKGVDNTAYIDLGSREQANKGLDELQKAMNGEPAVDVPFAKEEASTTRVESAGETLAKRIGLVVVLVAAAAIFYKAFFQ
jgi:hypothetical protein